MLSYLIWNVDPEIVSWGWFSLRWYGLLFALGFLLSQQILFYMFKREGKPAADVDTLTIYMVIATILGARLGHIIFYQPELFTQDPLGVLLPFQFTPEFKFTGLQGLASHGAAFGILFALWLYSNYYITFSGKSVEKEKEERKAEEAKAKAAGKTYSPPVAEPDGNAAIRTRIKNGFNFIKRVKPGQGYIETLDRIVILVTLTGALIRLGNFFNSEIVGKPTDSPFGVVFMNDVVDGIKRIPNNRIQAIEVRKDTTRPDRENGRKPIFIYLIFEPGTTEVWANTLLTDQSIQNELHRQGKFVDEPYDQVLDYQLVKESDGVLAARITTTGIAIHPSQLYESISCFVFFFILMWMWFKGIAANKPGVIFGLFMIVLWSLRFAYEFIKEPQVNFENSLPLFMGQILSIPLIIVGVYILVRAVQGKFKTQI